MHGPRTRHMEVVYRILRYLKSSLGKGLWLKKNQHLDVEGYCDVDWASNCRRQSCVMEIGEARNRKL